MGGPLKEDQAMDTTLNLTLVVAAQEELVAAGEQESVPAHVAAAAALTEFDQRDSAWTPRSQIARELQVAESTLRYWLRRRWQHMHHSRWPPQVVQFLESRDGLAFLHVLLTAAHLVFVQANDCGLRNWTKSPPRPVCRPEPRKNWPKPAAC
jgi:hypothetical protein